MKKILRIMTAALALSLIMTTCAFAAPSAETSPAPTPVAPSEQTGETVTPAEKPADKPAMEAVAVIKKADGTTVEVKAESIKVTPVTDLKDAPAEIREAVEKADKQIKAVKDLKEIAPDIADVLKEINEIKGTDFKTEQLVVRDLFDVTLDEEAKAILAEGGEIAITFAVEVADDEVLIVLHNYEGDKWETIPNDKVKVNADGTVEITFTSLSPVAFVTADKTAALEDTEEPAEPAETVEKDGGMSTGVIVVIVLVIIAAAAYFVTKSKKKDGKKENK